MTADKAKEMLLEKIVGLQGMKATQIATEFAVELQDFNVPELLDQMVKEGKIIEIEYTLPEMTWRCKSFYLPGGADVWINTPGRSNA